MKVSKHEIQLIIVLYLTMLLGSTSCGQGTALLNETEMPTTTLAPTSTKAPTATLATSATEIPTIQAGRVERKVTVGDLERSYLLTIPPGLDGQQAVPVMFAFHGLADNANNMLNTTGFDDIADMARFIVVYPRGIAASWNAGDRGFGQAMEQDVDETAFVRQILTDLDMVATIDAKRVYAAGFSQGGALVYRLACDMSGTFAAIAAVSGPMDYDACQPAHPVSILHVHGLADPIVPFSGGGGYGGSPVEDGINAWVRFDNCTDPTQIEKVENVAGVMTHTAYTGCQANSAIELYTIDGGGHRWPESTSEMIWNFFATHPKP